MRQIGNGTALGAEPLGLAGLSLHSTMGRSTGGLGVARSHAISSFFRSSPAGARHQAPWTIFYWVQAYQPGAGSRNRVPQRCILSTGLHGIQRQADMASQKKRNHSVIRTDRMQLQWSGPHGQRACSHWLKCVRETAGSSLCARVFFIPRVSLRTVLDAIVLMSMLLKSLKVHGWVASVALRRPKTLHDDKRSEWRYCGNCKYICARWQV